MTPFKKLNKIITLSFFERERKKSEKTSASSKCSYMHATGNFYAVNLTESRFFMLNFEVLILFCVDKDGMKSLRLIPYNVWVLKLLEEGDFSDSSAGHTLLLTLQADLLHSHHLSSGFIPALIYHTICA